VAGSFGPDGTSPQEEAIGDLIIREVVLTSDRARLHVRDTGSGMPIVVLHGGPDFDHEYLLPDLDRLAGQFRLVYYDQRGRGRSFTGEGPDDVTIDGELEDCDRVREWTGSRSVAVLGHSWGGLLAMEYAFRYPERVSHLILMNTAPVSHADMLGLSQAWRASRSPEAAARMTALRSDPAYQRGEPGSDLEYNRIHFSKALWRPEDLERLIGRFRVGFTPDGIVAARAIEESLYRQTLGLEGYDLMPQLRELRVPTLVIHGDHDFIPLDIPRHVAAAIPGARLEVVRSCGHFAYFEQPEQVGALITSFLTGR
jgi:proline iminopeptidase